jgi:hypothetical protein
VHDLWNESPGAFDYQCDEGCYDEHYGPTCDVLNEDTANGVDLWRICREERRLTPLQMSRIKHIHIFTDLAWLDERWLYKSKLWKAFKRDLPGLHSLTVTIRWIHWRHRLAYPTSASGHRLGPVEKITVLPSDKRLYDFDWVTSLLRPETNFSEFRLELEVLESRIDELRPILELLRSPEIHESSRFVWELVEPFEETTWSGEKLTWSDSIGSTRQAVDYHVFTLTWRRQGLRVDDEEQVEQL